MSRRLTFTGALAIGAAVLVAYYPSLGIGFFGDEWNYLRLASALPLDQYLNSYLNPNALAWYVYRPVQGIQYLIEYALFRDNAAGYHVAQILLHLAICLLLFSIVFQISENWRVGMVAALVFGTLSTYGWSVLWTADAAPLEIFFSMLAVWFWWRYLQSARWPEWACTLAAFILALFSRESSAVLPVVLVLVDRILSRKELRLAGWLKRYAPFALVLLLFLAIEYHLRMNTQVGIYPGYQLGPQVASTLLSYLTFVVYPWGLGIPWSYAWLFIAGVLYTYFVLAKKSRLLLVLGITVLVVLLPFAPYNQFNPRYLYAAAMGSAILLSLLFENAHQALPRAFLPGLVASTGITLLLFGNSLGVANKALSLAGLARGSRVPMRAVIERHSHLPDGTYLFFINPYVPSSDLGAMLFMHYRTVGASVRGTDLGGPADLRAYRTAFVYYRNAQGNWQEQAVNREATTYAEPALPITFGGSIRLEGYEIVNTSIKRHDPAILFLYWRALEPIGKDYTVFVHLIDERGQMVDGYDRAPRDGASPTSSWKSNQSVTDPVVFSIAGTVPDGDYRLEIGLYYLPTMQRLAIVDGQGGTIADSLVIGTIHVGE